MSWAGRSGGSHRALADRGVEVAEGSVGAGTGMVLFDYPGSRRESHGSCIAVCATDAPLSAQQLRRLALRPLLGVARTGSYTAEGSGEIAVAFSTAPEQDLPTDRLNPYSAAAYEHAGGLPVRGAQRAACARSNMK